MENPRILHVKVSLPNYKIYIFSDPHSYHRSAFAPSPALTILIECAGGVACGAICRSLSIRHDRGSRHTGLLLRQNPSHRGPRVFVRLFCVPASFAERSTPEAGGRITADTLFLILSGVLPWTGSRYSRSVEACTGGSSTAPTSNMPSEHVLKSRLSTSSSHAN